MCPLSQDILGCDTPDLRLGAYRMLGKPLAYERLPRWVLDGPRRPIWKSADTGCGGPGHPRNGGCEADGLDSGYAEGAGRARAHEPAGHEGRDQVDRVANRSSGRRQGCPHAGAIAPDRQRDRPAAPPGFNPELTISPARAGVSDH